MQQSTDVNTSHGVMETFPFLKRVSPFLLLPLTSSLWQQGNGDFSRKHLVPVIYILWVSSPVSHLARRAQVPQIKHKMAPAMGARVGLLFTLALRAFKWVFLVTEYGRLDRS